MEIGLLLIILASAWYLLSSRTQTGAISEKWSGGGPDYIPGVIRQPDSKEYPASQQGGFTIVNGLPVIQDKITGWWYYASVDGLTGVIISTGIKVGETPPDIATEGTNIPG